MGQFQDSPFEHLLVNVTIFFYSTEKMRRGGRVAEGARLESV